MVNTRGARIPHLRQPVKLGVYRVFDTEAVRDDNHSRVGTSFTGADGRSRVLRGKAPSGPELHRLVKAAG